MPIWTVQDATDRFGELLDICLKDGPQVVSRCGVEVAVLLPIEDWQRRRRAAQPVLKELLLGEGPRWESVVPPRGGWRRRSALPPE
jgi:antitoxin Phd